MSHGEAVRALTKRRAQEAAIKHIASNAANQVKDKSLSLCQHLAYNEACDVDLCRVENAAREILGEANEILRAVGAMAHERSEIESLGKVVTA